MALGNIVVNALNLAQGDFPTVEKFFLFIGVSANAPVTVGGVHFINGQTDLDAMFGSDYSDLKLQISKAKANAGTTWACCAVEVNSFADWDEAVDAAMLLDVKVEAIVVCPPVTGSSDFTAMNNKAIDINTNYGRRVFFIATTRAPAEVPGSPPTVEEWADYGAAMTTLTDGINAPRVMPVPRIFDEWPGMLAGRLCNDQTSVADTPMRVETGALVGIDKPNLPHDGLNQIYNNAIAKQLNDARMTVPQVYPDYPGVFCSDGQTLDAPIGDFAVIENLRVVDKAARAVRLVLIGLVGNRRFNSTPIGEAWAITKLSRPLFEMSRSLVFQGLPVPAEIKPPQSGDVAINWLTRTQVEVFLKVRPFDIPKEITANIVLDLSAPVN